MSEIIFRKAQVSDAAVISALAISVWVETYAEQGIEADFGRFIADHLSEAAYTDILGKSGYCALLAFRQFKLVAFALIALERDIEDFDGPASELEKLYIHRNFKGSGIGRALFDMAFIEAQDAGRLALWLSVNAGNERAIGFYRKLGLQQINDFYFDLNSRPYLNYRFIRVKT